MWEKIRVVFTIPELRNKILLTLALLAVYRAGYWITLPMVDQSQLMASKGGFQEMMERVAVYSASNLDQATIFGLGIMPYISASIILQLLQQVWKPLEELKKEGEAGRKKINEYTRYLTVLLCLVQSWVYVRAYLMGGDAESNLIHEAFRNPRTDTLAFGWQITAVLIMTSGTIFLMWLGEQIDEFGIGNGISLLIMAGILACLPDALFKLLSPTNMRYELVGLQPGQTGVDTVIVLALLFVAIVFGVVFMTLGQRRIPTQSAKHVRGRRVYGGNRQYLPLKLNQSGVMPIIFASSLLMVPSLIFQWFSGIEWIGEGGRSVFGFMTSLFNSGALTFNLLYVAMIYFFCYFWTAITFNPKEMSENLRDYGTFIPGIRPGKWTADYLEKVMERVTYVGAGFLAVVAVVPTVIGSLLKVDANLASFYGGTGLLIAVSVAFDLVQKIDSHLVMRSYRGLLEG